MVTTIHRRVDGFTRPANLPPSTPPISAPTAMTAAAVHITRPEKRKKIAAATLALNAMICFKALSRVSVSSMVRPSTAKMITLRRWYGYSVGRWDGNTFVVNTTGIDDRSWIDAYGDPHSIDLRVEESYTRTDPGHLRLDVTIDDPKAYSKPFVALAQPGLIFRLATKAGVAGAVAWSTLDLPEQMCVPSEASNYFGLVAAPANGKTGENTSK